MNILISGKKGDFPDFGARFFYLFYNFLGDKLLHIRTPMMIKYVSISGYLVFSNMTHNVIMDGQIFGRVLAIEITNSMPLVEIPYNK